MTVSEWSSSAGCGIDARSLRKVFERNGKGVSAVGDVTLQVARGSFVSILGPSGCGKSTLLRILAGLLKQTSGTIQVHGEEPEVFRESGKLGMAFQDPALFPWRSVAENVRLPFEVLSRSFSDEQLRELVERVGLGGREGDHPRDLSGGMKERVALARAVATMPSVLLLDEPFRSLDEMTRLRMNFEVQSLWMQLKPTTVMVTHSLDDALILSNEIFLLGDTPTRVRASWMVPMARPRTRSDMRSASYVELRNEILDRIFQEAEQ